MKKIYRSFRISKRDYSRTTGSTRYPRQTPAAEPEPNNTAPPVAPDNKPKTTSGDDTQSGQNQNNPAAVSKPPEWEKDEELVRGSHCLFRVKYLGAKEIFDSRGVDLCDEAFSSLMGRYKQYKRSENGLSSVIHSKLFKSTKNQTDASQTPARNALFYVSSDGLRVVDETRKSLIVDQTIEKVSFCAPVRVDKRGFAYIARDGATKRWMCHVLLAKNVDGEGERLSHAVGCAFSACVEAKKQRDALCSVQANFHNKNKSVFEKVGTFRDPKNTKLSASDASSSGLHSDSSEVATSTSSASAGNGKLATSKPTSKRVFGVVKNPIPEDEEWTPGQDENDSGGDKSNDPKAASSSSTQAQPDSAIERIHVPVTVLERMSSMKEFSKLNSKHDLPFSERSKRRNRTMNMKYSASASENLFNPDSASSAPLRPMDTNSAVEASTNSSVTPGAAPNIQTAFADNFDDSFTQSTTKYTNSEPSSKEVDFNIPSSFSVPSFTSIPPPPPKHVNAMSGHRPVPSTPQQSSLIATSSAHYSFFSSPPPQTDLASTPSVNNVHLSKQSPQTTSTSSQPQPKLSSTNPFYNFVSPSNQENSINVCNSSSSSQILSSSHITTNSSPSVPPWSNSQVTTDWSKAARANATNQTVMTSHSMTSYSVTNPFNNQSVH